MKYQCYIITVSQQESMPLLILVQVLEPVL